MVSWHSSSIEEVFKLLETSPKGISEEEAEKRLAAFGPNEIVERKESELFKLFRHLRDPLIYVLIVSGFITFYLGKLADSAIIFAVVAVNTTVGYLQERKAEKTLEKLKKMVEVKARVARRAEREIPARFLVPGDVIVLDRKINEPIDVLVEGVTKFLAIPGRSGGRKAVKIVKTIREE